MSGRRAPDGGGSPRMAERARDKARNNIRALREQYSRYQGPVEGQPQGPLSTIRLPHIKGSTPDRDVTPTESEPVGSESGGSGVEEKEEAQKEGESYTGIQSRETDTELGDTTPGRESWRSPTLGFGRGRLTPSRRTPHRGGSPGGVPGAGRQCFLPHPGHGDGVNAERTVVVQQPRDRG